MRIDAHVHFTSPSLKDNLAQFTEQEPYWGLLLDPGQTGTSLQGWATPERMLADMDQTGLDKVIVMGNYRQRPAGCRAVNDETIELVRRWPERVIGFAVLQPEPLQDALDELQRCLDSGLRGVGELGPYGQGYSMDDPGFLRVAEACIQTDIPLNLHVSEEVGHFYVGKSTTPLRHYYRMACRYPELKLILAHWGGGLLFYEIMPEVRQNLKNVYYDTAGSPLLYPTEAIFRVALQCLDHRKILYGSDYPLLVCPKVNKEPCFQPFIDQIDALDLPTEVYTAIMGGNAAHLLGSEKKGSQPDEKPLAKPRLSPIITEIETSAGLKITPQMAVIAVAQTWPETRAVFEKYGIPWRESIVPFWEPVVQSAAAHGLGPSARQHLVDELNEAIVEKEK
jgi:uncharacterized protein